MKIQRQSDAFAYRYALMAPPDDQVVLPRQPVTLAPPDEELLRHPAVEGFAEWLEAGIAPEDPAEALEEYLGYFRPEDRIHYEALQRYIGQEPTDTYPFPPVKGAPLSREPYAVVTYPPGFEHDYDDPRPGEYYARRTYRWENGDPDLHLAASMLRLATNVLLAGRVNEDYRQLQDRLHQEFKEWWASPASAPTQQQMHPVKHVEAGPLSNWMNIEGFLADRYPGSATGLGTAGVLAEEMDKNPQAQGDHVTAAMLGLHNRLQGREWMDEADEERYLDFMLRHVGPNAGKKVAISDHTRFQQDFGEDLKSGEPMDEQQLRFIDYLSRFHDMKANDRGEYTPRGGWPNDGA